MGKRLGCILITIFIQHFSLGKCAADNCVSAINEPDTDVTVIEVNCPGNVQYAIDETLTKAIKDKVEITKPTNQLKMIVKLKMTPNIFPELNNDQWQRIIKFEMENNDLEEIPKFLYKATNIEEIKLSKNKIQHLERLNTFSKLKKLDLSSNQISSTLDLNEFKQVKSIDFSNNYIEHLNNGNTIDDDPSYLENINLNGNRIVNIPNAYFEKCTKLKTLNLGKNSIKDILITGVHGLDQLETLDLSYNDITDLGHTLYRFINLKTLLLGFNKIETVRNYTFNSMRKLIKLDLSSNRLNYFSDDVFSDLIKLEILILKNNNLTTIRKKMFERNAHLAELDVSENKINEIEPESFKHNKISVFKFEKNQLHGVLNKDIFQGLLITNLDLSDSGITEVGSQAFSTLSNLKTLNLANNDIKIITKTAFQSLSKLEKLDISKNSLIDLEFAEYGLEQLKTLILSENNIKKISNKDLANLQKLDYFSCSKCSLNYIEKDVFEKAVSLTQLDLSHNSISEFEFMTKVSNTLNTLDLSDNKLKNIDLLKKFVQLQKLYCSHNILTQIKDDTFSSMTLLETVDLSSNENLMINRHFNKLPNLKNVLLSGIKKVDFTDVHDTIIEKLDLSSTGIKSLSSVFLANIKDLKQLYLSQNDISDLDKSFDKMPSLNTLDLSGNKINNIKRDNFKNIAQLQHLSLANNTISTLDNSIFSDLRDLITIDLSNNNIQIINYTAFKENIKLETLKLSSNQIYFLNINAFHGLSALKNLYLNKNRLTEFGPYNLPDDSSDTNIYLDDNLIESMRFKEFSNTNIKSLRIKRNPISCKDIYEAKSIFTEKHKTIEFGSDVCDNNGNPLPTPATSTNTPSNETTSTTVTPSSTYPTSASTNSSSTSIDDASTTENSTIDSKKDTTIADRSTVSTNTPVVTDKVITSVPSKTALPVESTGQNDKLLIILICVSSISLCIIAIFAVLRLRTYCKASSLVP